MPIQISQMTGSRRRAATAESCATNELQALRAIPPGHVGAYWESLSAAQKTNMVRALVIYTYEQDARLADLERTLTDLVVRLAGLGG